MSVTVTLNIDIDVECKDCGFDMSYSEREVGGCLVVEPCPNCALVRQDDLDRITEDARARGVKDYKESIDEEREQDYDRGHR